jgi:diguanylate cyclase (GGDEF)-like protein
MPDNSNQNKLLKSGYLVPRDLVLYILIFILGLIVGFLIGNKQYLESANLFAGVILLVIYILIIYFYIEKLIKTQKAEHKKIELQLSTDQLTQLFNKEYFYGLFEIELSRSFRYKRNLSCLLMEIDDIHDIFDKYGDKYGDKIIQDTAEILKDNSRVTDILARFDGYQFICLFTETDMEATILLCKRLRALFSGEECETDEGETIFVTSSIGVTEFNPDVDKHVDIFNMIKAARKALDIAKERGGNRIEYFELAKI